MSWRNRTAAWPWDVLLAIAVTALAEVAVVRGNVSGPRWETIPIGVLLGAPLAWRRTYPWPMLLCVFGSLVLIFVLKVSANHDLASVVAALVALYSFQAVTSWRSGLLGFAFAFAATALETSHQPQSNLGWLLILLGGASLTGRIVRSRRLLIDELTETTAALRRSREENARAAVVDERTRIARELHDVVAHAVSVIVVQAGAAERMLDQDPARSRVALQSVQDSGRQALAELRRLLGVLRPDSPEPAGLIPQPGLADLPALTAQLQDAGLSVEVTRHGQVRPLSPGVDLAAYRIVQEALTNVLKHSTSNAAKVAVRYGPDAVDIEVDNAGADKAGADVAASGTVHQYQSANGGHGLPGMRERAALYGGQLHAGPALGGGYPSMPGCRWRALRDGRRSHPGAGRG